MEKHRAQGALLRGPERTDGGDALRAMLACFAEVFRRQATNGIDGKRGFLAQGGEPVPSQWRGLWMGGGCQDTADHREIQFELPRLLKILHRMTGRSDRKSWR